MCVSEALDAGPEGPVRSCDFPFNPYAAGGLFGQQELMTKSWVMTETMANGYSSESTRRELSNECQLGRVSMVFENICVLVLCMKVASAAEGLTPTHEGQSVSRPGLSKSGLKQTDCFHTHGKQVFRESICGTTCLEVVKWNLIQSLRFRGQRCRRQYFCVSCWRWGSLPHILLRFLTWERYKDDEGVSFIEEVELSLIWEKDIQIENTERVP